MDKIFGVLMPVALFGGFGTTLYYFTKVMTDYILKKKMIEKGYVTEDTQSLFREKKLENKYSALKWGLLVFAGGVGLIIIDALPVGPESTLPYGIFAVCLSLGFLTYYFIIKKEVK
jgi:hypothetical protein